MMSRARTIELEKEECDIVYNQLSARIQDFESMMIQAANKKNTKRVLEIAEIIKTLQSVMNKLLGV
jgi:hypothetical protein